MYARKLLAALVALVVLIVWLYSVRLRLPYLDQIPVYDADVTTGAAHMWARMWWDEGAFKLWFSEPLSPRSIETPTLAWRELYESWPPGAIVPVFLAAKFFGIYPNVQLVNWINTGLHGLIALAVAFTAFNLGRLNRLGSVSSALIAVAVSLLILLSRGPLFVFSQIYDYVTAVLIFTAIFILLEVHFYGAKLQSDKRLITALQMITIFCACLVDWLSYTLFAFWLVSRLVAGYVGVEPRLTLRRFIGLSLVPVSAFSIYIVWRVFAPGSIASTYGLVRSAGIFIYKIKKRMNLTEDGHVTGFGEVFFGLMHREYYTQFAFPLIVASTLIALTLLIVAFRRATDILERRSIFANLSIMMLVIVPFYLHMLILYEHTFIHRWAITKAMFAYALVPFALLPISVFVLARQFAGPSRIGPPRRGAAAAGLALSACALFFAVSITRVQDPAFFMMGPIDRDNYLMWDDIGRNTIYQDVVVSPVLQADPISKEIGVSYKLVHHADSFADVDKVVDRVCGDFNVVVALPKGTELGAFASRESALVIDTGRIRLFRFAFYPGKAIGCP